uniref:Ankyrin repeat protein n=1 Tax=Megaviridae environmental sample TaxID=1737588 RepID=A0A5J6VIS9_9VIRU|nr:MAG: hypothetical protein [Megaviridae environmental sample]
MALHRTPDNFYETFDPLPEYNEDGVPYNIRKRYVECTGEHLEYAQTALDQLLELGHNVDLLLMIAVDVGHDWAIQKLMERGADVYVRPKNMDRTILGHAVHKDDGSELRVQIRLQIEEIAASTLDRK